jgi:dihydrolipoamide dehydrogenase
MISTQLAVVGGGPGGYAAAFLAADLGLQVVLIDPEAHPGGVCVYRGCIPSKALLHVAQVISASRHAANWGVDFGEPRIDLNKLRGHKDAVIGRLTAGTGQLVKHRKVRYLQGRAEVVDAHNLLVKLQGGGDERVRCDHAILATGSRPVRVPSLALDSHRVWDSTTAL